MIDAESTLADVCFAVSHALETAGISAVLTGGSAASLYAPDAYASLDADFVVKDDATFEAIARALAELGFSRDGRSRMFVHPATSFTIDFPRGPLAVGGDYVRETATLRRGGADLKILTPTDCVRDRLAHFYHWNDYTALRAAVGVAAAMRVEIDVEALRSWSMDEGHVERFSEFERRIAHERLE